MVGEASEVVDEAGQRLVPSMYSREGLLSGHCGVSLPAMH